MKTIESGKLAARGFLIVKSIKDHKTLDKSVKNKIQLKVLYFTSPLAEVVFFVPIEDIKWLNFSSIKIS